MAFNAPLPPTRATGDTGPAADMNLVTAAITEVRTAVTTVQQSTTQQTTTLQIDGTGATDVTAAIQAAINAIKTTGGVITFAPGTYRINGSLNANSSYNVVLRGLGAQGADRFGPWNTTLLFNQGGTSACITARASQGFTIDNLAVINNNTGYTGSIVDVGSPGDPTPTYRCTFRNGYIGGPGGTTITAKNAYAAINLGQVVEAVIENMVFGRTQYGLVGRSATEPGFSNVITMIGGRFAELGTAAVLNPFANWTFLNTVFEPTPSGAPAGIVCTAQYPARALSLVGASFWDGTVAGVWIDFYGTGLNMNGVYAEVNTGTLVRLNGTVYGFTSQGGFMLGSSSGRYLAMGSGASAAYVKTGDTFSGGLADNTSSFARSMAFTANYQPTLKSRTVTAGTVTLGLTDIGSLILCDTSGGTVAINLPDPALSPGGTLIFKKVDTSGNIVGVNGFTLAGVNAARSFVSDGSSWNTTSIVASH